MQAIRRFLVDVTGIDKSGLFVNPKRCGVVLFDADLHAVVFSLFFKFRHNHPQSCRAEAFSLKPGIDHELLQVITGRLLIQILYQSDTDHCFIVGNADDSRPVTLV